MMKHLCHHGGPRFYSNFYPLLQPDEAADLGRKKNSVCCVVGGGVSGEVVESLCKKLFSNEIQNMENSKIWRFKICLTHLGLTMYLMTISYARWCFQQVFAFTPTVAVICVGFFPFDSYVSDRVVQLTDRTTAVPSQDSSRALLNIRTLTISVD